MKNYLIIISVMSLICGCTHVRQDPAGFSNAKANSYYTRLCSLLTTKDSLDVEPKSTGRDVNLIENETGAAGVLFGATMDDVVAVWGKPSGLMINDGLDDWSLYIGACRFDFIDNSLVTISTHSASLPCARFENGIDYASSVEDVLSAFGKPIKASDYKYEFVNENGYVTDFHFSPDRKSKGEANLISIEISHPDA
jgi:hypothetical protein